MPAKSQELDTLRLILKTMQEQAKTLHTIAHELRAIKDAVAPVDTATGMIEAYLNRSKSTSHDEGDSEVES